MTVWDAVEPVLTLGLSVSSLVIASRALSESARNGQAQREHNRLSVKPAVHSWIHTLSDKNMIILEIRNNGVGPAIIDRLCLVDMEMATEFPIDQQGLSTLIQSRLGVAQPYAIPRVKSIGPQYTLPANESLELFQVEICPDEQQTIHYYAARLRKKLSFFISYRSIYDEQFEAFDP